MLKRCIRKRRIPKLYAKYGLFLLPHDYQVAYATMMRNECFMIYIYICIYIYKYIIYIYIFLYIYIYIYKGDSNLHTMTSSFSFFPNNNESEYYATSTKK